MEHEFYIGENRFILVLVWRWSWHLAQREHLPPLVRIGQWLLELNYIPINYSFICAREKGQIVRINKTAVDSGCWNRAQLLPVRVPRVIVPSVGYSEMMMMTIAVKLSVSENVVGSNRIDPSAKCPPLRSIFTLQ